MNLLPFLLLLTSCSYLTKHEGKQTDASLPLDELLDVFPSSAIDDFFDVILIHPMHRGEFCHRMYASSVGFSNESDIERGEFGGVVRDTHIRSAMHHPVPSIFFDSSPYKVIEPIVISNAVKVSSLHPHRSRPNKCLKNQNAIPPCIADTVFVIQRVNSVPLVISTFEKTKFGLVLSWPSVAFETPKVGNLITSEFNDFFPNFFHAEELA